MSELPAQNILPELTPIPGLVLNHWSDLFTPEEYADIQATLAQMARERRASAASAMRKFLP